MEITKEKLLETLEDIRKLIIDSEKPDGSLGLDLMQTAVALEFTILRLKKRFINKRRWKYAFTNH